MDNITAVKTEAKPERDGAWPARTRTAKTAWAALASIAAFRICVFPQLIERAGNLHQATPALA